MVHALVAHSWLRWVIVVLAIVIVVRALRQRRYSARPLEALAGLAKLQLLLGLALLLWLSPIAKAAWSGGVSTVFSDPALAFFGLIHPGLMTVGVGVLDYGRVRARKAIDDGARHRITLRTTLAWLAIAALAIPWPGTPWERPLARVELSAGKPAATPLPAIYGERCATCHGAGGNADGPLAPTLSPQPRAFTDLAWQRAVTDEHLHAIIREGGAAHGKSPLMPAHRDLSPATIDQLVHAIRSLQAEVPR